MSIQNYPETKITVGSLYSAVAYCLRFVSYATYSRYINLHCVSRNVHWSATEAGGQTDRRLTAVCDGSVVKLVYDAYSFILTSLCRSYDYR